MIFVFKWLPSVDLVDRVIAVFLKLVLLECTRKIVNTSCLKLSALPIISFIFSNSDKLYDLPS